MLLFYTLSLGIPKLLVFMGSQLDVIFSDNRIIDALYYLIQQDKVSSPASGSQQPLAVPQSGSEWLESSPAEQGLNMSQECALCHE